jgi:hypothetical protein
MKRVLLEYREERSEDVEDKIQDMIRAAVYKYRNGMDSQDTFQNVYLDYLEKFKDTEDEWFRDPRNLRILAVSFKNKIFDLYDMYKRRYKTQMAMPSSGIEETVLEYMEQNTIVCGVTSDGSVVYEAF